MMWHTDPQDQQRLEVFLEDNTVHRYPYVYMEEQPITADIPTIQQEKK